MLLATSAAQNAELHHPESKHSHLTQNKNSTTNLPCLGGIDAVVDRIPVHSLEVRMQSIIPV